MKNRNIPYYMAVLALTAGMSTSFVSCVDTDEPETVTKLRQEAINKLAADTDLQKALAEVERAKVKYNEALAAVQNADAAIKNAQAKTADLDNQITEAGLENAKQAKIQEQLAALEAEKEKYEQNRLRAAKEAAKYESEYQAALKDAQDRLAEIAGQKNKALTEALTAYVDAQQEVLSKKVAYNDALKAAEVGGETPAGSHKEVVYPKYTDVVLDEDGKIVYQTIEVQGDPIVVGSNSYYDYVTGQNVTYNIYKTDPETGEIVYTKKYVSVPLTKEVEGNPYTIDVPDTKEIDGTVDYKAEVALKQVALDLAKANKADIEAVFADPDFEKWSTKYSEAEEAIATLDGEIAEIKINLAANTGAIEAKKEEVDVKKQALEDEYTKWADDVTTLSLACSESLKIEKFGKTNNVVYLGSEGQYKLQYYNGTVTALIQRGTEYKPQIKNSEIASVLNAVKGWLSEYEDDYKANTLKKEWQDAQANFDKGTIKTAIEGTHKAEDIENGLKYNGAKATFTVSLYNAYANETDETEKAKKKKAYEDAANQMVGGTKDPQGHDLNGVLPTDEKILEDVTNNASLWGNYGNYLKTKDNIAKLEAKYNNYVEASAIYNTIEQKAKSAGDLVAAKVAEKNDKLANDAAYVKLQAELKALKDEKTEITSTQALKELEKAKNEGVQNAINTACGLFDDDDENLAKFDLDNFGEVAKIKDVLIAVAEADVNKAQAELDAAKSALENHNKGLSDAQVAVEYAKKQIEIAEEKEKLAKEKYEEVKKAYGITE